MKTFMVYTVDGEHMQIKADCYDVQNNNNVAFYIGDKITSTIHGNNWVAVKSSE